MNSVNFIPSESNTDPRYQYLQNMNDESRESDVVSVIAKVNDIKAWKQLPQVQTNTEIPITGKCWLVTGKIPYNQFEYINSKDFVNSLKLAQNLRTIQEVRKNKINHEKL